METFLRCGKLVVPEEKDDHNNTIEALMDEMENVLEQEPWDIDDNLDIDDLSLEQPRDTSISQAVNRQDGTPPGTIEQPSSEPWDLDDQTLLDFVQEPAQDIIEKLTSSAGPVLQTTPKSTPKPLGECSFVRLHGPLDRAIEKLLEALPDPLIELLSEDVSSDLSKWSPAPALLYKLRPPDLPLHRLRLKVGCTVALLRDLDSSSQASKSRHVRIVGITKERLDCVVLDGHLARTKTFLTRIRFTGRYKNEEQYAYTRTHFPVRVVSFAPPPGNPSAYTASHTLKRPHGHTVTIPSNQKSSCLGPRSSASSQIPKAPPPSVLKLPNLKVDQDCWDDFLASGTQIARELSAETAASPGKMSSLSFCTQDLDFSADDLEELGSAVDTGPGTRDGSCQQGNRDRFSMPPPPRPTLSTARLKDNGPQFSQRGQPVSCSKSDSLRLDPSLRELGISTQDLVSFCDDATPVFSQVAPI
jgi:hypothetical protein